MFDANQRHGYQTGSNETNVAATKVFGTQI